MLTEQKIKDQLSCVFLSVKFISVSALITRHSQSSAGREKSVQTVAVTGSRCIFTHAHNNSSFHISQS